MKLAKVNQKEFLEFLESIHLNKLIESTIIEVQNGIMTASGATLSGTLFFNANFTPTEIYEEGVLAISSLPDFISFVKRADSEFTINLTKTKVNLKGKKQVSMALNDPESVRALTNMDGIKFSGKNKAFKSENQGYLFQTPELDLSSIDFKDTLKDVKLVSKGAEPRIIFKESTMILQNIQTDHNVEIPIEVQFEKDMVFESGELSSIFKTNPKTLKMHKEKFGKNYVLFIANDKDFYVLQGLEVQTGSADNLPF